MDVLKKTMNVSSKKNNNFRVLIYRYRFLTNDGFDNKYVTEDFFQLDMRRAKHNRETVLPLNKKEEKLYVKVRSLKKKHH